MLALNHKTSRFKDGCLFPAEYHLAVEQPLEIFIDDSPYAVTMRLPGDDINLAAGFCLTEGLIDSIDDVLSISHCDKVPDEGRILVRLNPSKGDSLPHKGRNAFLSKSSCGLCGKTGIEEIYAPTRRIESVRSIELHEVLRLKSVFEKVQTIFPQTGTTHAAAVFDEDGQMISLAEDIGRHNAFDKAIGRLLFTEKRDKAFMAMLSSRLSFEMVQKAGVLGLEILTGLSGPTSLAVQMAHDLNMTLIGFLREMSMSIYTHPEKILYSPEYFHGRELAALGCR
jgi:FdhD protein